MNTLRKSLIAAASVLALAGVAQAQTGTTTTRTDDSNRAVRTETDRGVPGVDVDVGRNANGAVDVKRANTERARGVPGVDVDTGRNARGAVDVDVGRDGTSGSGTSARAPRADRN